VACSMDRNTRSIELWTQMLRASGNVQRREAVKWAAVADVEIEIVEESWNIPVVR
jgi:hypothetical protein